MRSALAAHLQTLRSSPALAAGVLAWLIAGLVLMFRVPVGTASTDEAFYSAMTYGFLLGNKPYLDELAFHQNAAILLMPFYRAYVWLRGGLLERGPRGLVHVLQPVRAQLQHVRSVRVSVWCAARHARVLREAGT